MTVRQETLAYQLGLTLAEYNTICMLFRLVHVVDSGEGPYMAWHDWVIVRLDKCQVIHISRVDQ